MEVDHPQHVAEGADLEAPGLDFAEHGMPGRAPITRQQGLDASRRADPRAVASRAPAYQLTQDVFVQEGQVARDDDHGVRAGDLEGGVQSTDGAEAGQTIRMDDKAEVSEPAGIGADDEHGVRDALQDVDLPDDDGASLNDEATLVLPAEAPGASAGQYRSGGGGTAHGAIMTEVRIGRLLAASLHQAISEALSDRLEYYEYWLSSEGLRDGSIGAAPISAVLGFLRTEGPAYDAVMAKAGEFAAAWTVASLPPYRRRAIAWLPRTLRARAALRVATRIVRGLSTASRTTMRIRGYQASVEITSSMFCTVRDAYATPLCGFYVAVAVETLRQFDLPAVGTIERCRAVSGSASDATCVIRLDLTGAGAVSPAMAA